MTAISITPANVAISGNGRTETGVFGATIAAGQVVLKDSTTRRYELADSNDTSLDEVYGIALNGGSDGQPGSVALPGSEITIGGTLTAGVAYYLGATAGSIVPYGDLTTNDRVIFLGIAKSAAVLIFRPIDSGVTL